MAMTPDTWQNGRRRRPAGRMYGGFFLKGMAMGCADLVPGVSGGTIALILGIYEQLIHSIRRLGRAAFWHPLMSLKPGQALLAVDAPFLATVFAGMLFAIVAFARALSWLAVHHPVMLASFFFGLVAASVLVVAGRVRRWRSFLVVGFLASAVSAYALAGLAPAQTPETIWFVALSGAIAVCALILPGISGAFILLLLGKYQFMLDAVSRVDLAVIAVFGVGAVIGLVSFAQLLGWLLKRFHDVMLIVLAGLMLGSLRKLWPWKEADELAPEELTANTLPSLFEAGRLNPEVPLGLLFALLGLAAVLGMNAFESGRLQAARKDDASGNE